MRLRGRQARFLAVTLLLWCGVRIIQLWPGISPTSAISQMHETPATLPRFIIGTDIGTPAPGFVPWPEAARTQMRGVSLPSLPAYGPDPAPNGGLLLLLALGSGASELAPQAVLRHAAFAYATAGDGRMPADAAPPPAGLASPGPASPRDKRWSAEAYLYGRSGSGRAALSPEGQLGGSQAALRATYKLNPSARIRVDAAVRIYAPLRSKGAEVAAGLDIHPFGAAPFRLSVERRQRLDRAGRSAWSAYAAGGFYREDMKRGVILDGYAQTGIVGTARRDLFVDGALRAGMRVDGAPGLTVGGGIWGAAQPGVARIDAGPRVAYRLALADHGLSLAIEGRFRVAGRARPGSGIAITLGADL